MPVTVLPANTLFQAQPAQKDVILTIPANVSDIATYIMTVAGAGRIRFSTARLVAPVLAHGQWFWYIPPYSETDVINAFGPVEVSADYYSSEIIVAAYVGYKRQSIYAPTQLTKPLSIPAQCIYDLRDAIYFEFYNDTDVDVETTIDLPVYGVDKTIWDGLLIPLMRLGYKSIESMVRASLGGQQT